MTPPIDLADSRVARLLFRGRAERAAPWLPAATLFVTAVAPRLGWEPLAGYGLGLDDAAWLALLVGALACRPPRAAVALPMAAAFFVAALSVVGRRVPELAPGLLSLAKLAQLFSVYVAARATGAEPERIARAAAWAVLALSAIGLAEVVVRRHEMPLRIFDNALYPGQTNHVAGFVALSMPLLLRAGAPDRKLRMLAAAAGVAVVLLSASRGALLGLAAGVIAALLMTPRRRIAGLAALGAAAALLAFGPARTRISWIDREVELFRYTLERELTGMPPVLSPSRVRLANARIAMDELRRAPLLGTGLGSRHRVFYENAGVMIAAETGLVGLACALWLAAALVRRSLGDPVALPILLAFAVLSLGAVTVVITRLAAPLWIFLAALERD
jgi:hypothetical protein